MCTNSSTLEVVHFIHYQDHLDVSLFKLNTRLIAVPQLRLPFYAFDGVEDQVYDGGRGGVILGY